MQAKRRYRKKHIFCFIILIKKQRKNIEIGGLFLCNNFTKKGYDKKEAKKKITLRLFFSKSKEGSLTITYYYECTNSIEST